MLLSLVLCFSSYSRAGDPLTYIYNDPAAVSYNLADDGDVFVPISFWFPYYDQVFNQSWMYSNGVIDFKGGGFGYCCDGQDLSKTPYNYSYMLMPFWTDLIASTITSFYTLDTGQSITYGWYNINEYGTSSISSFEVQLFANGQIDYRYSSAAATGHSVTIGMTGNLNAGQYNQYYTGYGASVLNTTYSANFALPPPPPPDPCLENPLYNISCPGYYSAQAVQDAIDDASAKTVVVPPPQTGVVEDPTSTYNEVRTDAGGASITTTGAIKIEDGVPDVVKDSLNNNVTNNDIIVKQDATVAVDPTKATKEDSKKVAAPKAAEKQAGVPSNDFDIDQYVNQSSMNMSSMQSQQDTTMQDAGYENSTPINMMNSYNNVITNTLDDLPEQMKPQTIDLNKNDIKQENKEQKETNEAVNKNIEPNEAAAGGIDAAEFARPIDGFLSYSKLALTDSNFYKTKEIYKNQKTVDNQSILRRLNAKSDKLHEEMVNQQYR